ncbi:MAG: hypothetical protein NT007_13250, partial [Candidatus Kapabacteria bacterium]|nr:hypothetical protein [Candidatus Kapabacteria bacterium]
MKKCFVFALTATLWLSASLVFADNYFADTVWTNKTDQADGFYMVKFSKNDSIIAGMGYQMDLFYDAATGAEIHRIPFNSEVHFINNDQNFVRLAASRNKLEIWDTKTFIVIDSLESDGTTIGSIDISSDEKFIVGVIPKGIRSWNLITKKILKTQLFQSQPNLTEIGIRTINFACDNSKFIGSLGRIYTDPNPPNKQYGYGWDVIYDFNTLDSVDVLGSYQSFKLSNTCKYFTDKIADSFKGVE